MNERDSLNFEIRYAERVMRLQARLWRRIDISGKLLSLLGGSAAFAALGANHRYAALAGGIVLAAAQAFDLIVRPGDCSSAARQSAKGYAAVAARAHALDDAVLRGVFEAAVEADDVDAIESLRRIAYNEALIELDGDPAELYTLTLWQRFVQLLM